MLLQDFGASPDAIGSGYRAQEAVPIIVVESQQLRPYTIRRVQILRTHGCLWKVDEIVLGQSIVVPMVYQTFVTVASKKVGNIDTVSMHDGKMNFREVCMTE